MTPDLEDLEQRLRAVLHRRPDSTYYTRTNKISLHVDDVRDLLDIVEEREP